MSIGKILVWGGGLLAASALLSPARRAPGTLVSQERDSEAAKLPLEVWPVAAEETRIGDDVLVLRADGHHQGVDLHVPADSIVVAPEAMAVLRVVDGTNSAEANRRRAGQWVDARGRAGRILRFLHLRPGSVSVRQGQLVAAGEIVGRVAPLTPPHLHFEVRASDWNGTTYGPVINPVDVLPNTGPPALLRRLAALRQPGRAGLS